MERLLEAIQLSLRSQSQGISRTHSLLCVCEQVGDADHYTFSCSLTEKFHLVKPADAHKRAWFQNLTNNSQALNILKEAFRISGDVCDSLTQAV
ncbi:hypothetical protein AVEN_83269-1 [Araneus ventricosus]|uniref:Uncharacterized protein n=1 Tax=Araneus ventricosus TaxID=182803 RepID=A0A4Y2WRR5_ARAVE|nr:hypothetical protein AVEN_246895-1 [Araneus ventricosus]GBO40187.1 hypothetical protein AVEN_83269-1 [Araneus ventricosus]